MFAYERDFDKFIRDCIERFKPLDDVFYNQQVMIELYETYFGIRDHMRDPSPLGSVSYNKAEQYMDNGMYYNYILLYMRKKIHKLMGMSFDDFVNRPRYEIELILKAANSILNQEEEVNRDALNELEKAKSKTNDMRIEL